MAFDPTLPQTNAPIVSAELREAFGVRPACWRCRKAGVVRKREQAPRTPNAARHRTLRSTRQTLSAGRLRQARLNRIHAVGNGERTRPRVPFSAPSRKTGGGSTIHRSVTGASLRLWPPRPETARPPSQRPRAVECPAVRRRGPPRRRRT